LTPVRADLLWRVTFATDQYCECYPGAAGFHWLALIGVLPLGLVSRRTRGITICALLGASMVFVEVRYFRYILPMLVLLLPVFAASLRTFVSQRVLTFVFILLTVINVLYGTNASWVLRGGTAKSMIYPSQGRKRVPRSLAPERLVADYMKGSYGKEVRFLLADPGRPYAAPFAGTAFTTAWYDPETTGILFGGAADPDARTWLGVFQRLGISHVLGTPTSQTSGLEEALRAAEAEVELRLADVTLYRLEGGFLPADIGNGTTPHPATWLTHQEHYGPAITDARVHVVCTKPESSVFVVVRGYDDGGRELSSEGLISSCPKAGDASLAVSFLTDVTPTRLEFETSIDAVQRISPEVRFRKDAMRSRSLSA
jgi:hypothetical protein